MTTNKRGLGKGLDALLATSTRALEAHQGKHVKTEDALRMLTVDCLIQGQYQPRKAMDDQKLEELAASIEQQGVLQPLVVRSIDHQQFEIIAGERRYRAAILAGLQELPCWVKEIDDQAAGAVALIENIQREDLNIIEQAQALQRLIHDFALTHQQLAELLGKSRATISNILRLNTLVDGVKAMVLAGDLDMGHARAILALDANEQLPTALQVIQKNSVFDKLRHWLKRSNVSQKKSLYIPHSPYNDLQEKLTDRLGMPVTLVKGKGETGKLVISFDQNEKLMQILSIFDEKL